jgi:hypothetical protein
MGGYSSTLAAGPIRQALQGTSVSIQRYEEEFISFVDRIDPLVTATLEDFAGEVDWPSGIIRKVHRSPKGRLFVTWEFQHNTPDPFRFFTLHVEVATLPQSSHLPGTFEQLLKLWVEDNVLEDPYATDMAELMTLASDLYERVGMPVFGQYSNTFRTEDFLVPAKTGIFARIKQRLSRSSSHQAP